MILRKRSYFGWGSVNAGNAPCKNGAVAHYDGSNTGLANKPHSACIAYWKRTRTMHMRDRGWNDIGYAFGVCPHGEIFEGRGRGKTQAAQPGGNSTWTSCTFMSGPSEKPTEKQLQAWAEWRAWMRAWGMASAVQGHQFFVATGCPGKNIMTLVRDGTLKRAPSGTTKPTTNKMPTFKRTLKQPPVMSGADVKTWQGKMRQRGWTITVDGHYGPQSEVVCRKFQTEKRLRVSGNVDETTWNATWKAAIT